MNILGMNIDWFKLLILLIIGLLVVGPEKLPSYARKAARFVRNFEKVTKSLTGEISRAINLNDEEDDKASGVKKDLLEVKKSLEKDVSDLKAALDTQARAVSETMESGTRDAAIQLEKNAGEISGSLSTLSDGLNPAPNAQVTRPPEPVEASAPENTSQAEQDNREALPLAEIPKPSHPIEPDSEVKPN